MFSYYQQFEGGFISDVTNWDTMTNERYITHGDNPFPREYYDRAPSRPVFVEGPDYNPKPSTSEPGGGSGVGSSGGTTVSSGAITVSVNGLSLMGFAGLGEVRGVLTDPNGQKYNFGGWPPMSGMTFIDFLVQIPSVTYGSWMVDCSVAFAYTPPGTLDYGSGIASTTYAFNWTIGFPDPHLTFSIERKSSEYSWEFVLSMHV